MKERRGGKAVSSLSWLMTPFQQDLQLAAAACEVSLRLNGSLASEQRMDDDNCDGNDNEKELDVTHYRSSV